MRGLTGLEYEDWIRIGVGLVMGLGGIVMLRWMYHLVRVVQHQMSCNVYEVHSKWLWPVEASVRLLDDLGERVWEGFRVCQIDAERIKERAREMAELRQAERESIDIHCEITKLIKSSDEESIEKRLAILCDRGTRSNNHLTAFGRMAAYEVLTRYFTTRLQFNR